MGVDPVIAPSAQKHGISDEDMLHAYRNAFDIEAYDEGLMMAHGVASNGVTIVEVGFVVDAADDVVVIVHAMRSLKYR